MAVAAEITESMAFRPLCLDCVHHYPAVWFSLRRSCKDTVLFFNRRKLFNSCFDRRSYGWTGKTKLLLSPKLHAHRSALPRSTHLSAAAEQVMPCQGAQIGKGVLFDHATGVVIGETTVIGDNVSILHHVTLGGTGNCCEDRHPKIGNGVLIGAAAILLGAINVGDGAKIGACSLVLNDVPAYTTAIGVPAKILGDKNTPVKEEMPALSMDHTSLILDYII